MSIFLAGVPGKLKKLLDRVTNSTVPLNDTRVGALDYLDASILSRAPSSTALSTALWDTTKAGYLDASIASSRYPVQDTLVIGDDANITALNQYSPGKQFGSVTVSAGGYTEIVSVTNAGFLWWASTWRGSAFTSGTLNIRITLDGVVAILTANATSSTVSGTGIIGVGAIGNSVGTPIPMLMPLRFRTSMKIEVTSSATQSGGNDIYGSYIYTLD